MSTIKLLKIGTLANGTQRFQSQLYVGRDVADFILKDEIMKCYGNENNGFDFYEYHGKYKIVNNKKDMNIQTL